ncbi:hypothetical protein CDAR_231791 [Caerostris darwini]|uniref:Uncharacterized protein n=1 Tax=Caerostris darwini TaxID=1538125 RepID=A0AAV4TVN6_9ARAC|nr:hypothetical protein CDAR_231791 [Caerostris darwini]
MHFTIARNLNRRRIRETGTSRPVESSMKEHAQFDSRDVKALAFTMATNTAFCFGFVERNPLHADVISTKDERGKSEAFLLHSSLLGREMSSARLTSVAGLSRTSSQVVLCNYFRYFKYNYS